MYDARKSVVIPDDFSVFIQQRIGNVQFPQKLLLNLSVLRGKAHQFIDDDRPVVKHQVENHPEVQKQEA